jgi:hypothetical protein
VKNVADGEWSELRGRRLTIWLQAISLVENVWEPDVIGRSFSLATVGPNRRTCPLSSFGWITSASFESS